MASSTGIELKRETTSKETSSSSFFTVNDFHNWQVTFNVVQGAMQFLKRFKSLMPIETENSSCGAPQFF